MISISLVLKLTNHSIFHIFVPTSTLVIGLACYMPNLSHIVFIGMSQLMCLNKGHNEPLIVLNIVCLLLKITYHFAFKKIMRHV
jgi:hypothetical protein